MNVILVSGGTTKARSFILGAPQLTLLGVGVFLAVISLSVLLHYFSLRYAVINDSPYLRSLLVSLQAQENERMQSYMRDSLNTMASKLGELQARVLRIDALESGSPKLLDSNRRTSCSIGRRLGVARIRACRRPRCR